MFLIKPCSEFLLLYVLLILLSNHLNDWLGLHSSVGMNVGGLVLAILVIIKFNAKSFIENNVKIIFSLIAGSCSLLVVSTLPFYTSEFNQISIPEGIVVLIFNTFVAYFTLHFSLMGYQILK